MARGSMGSPRRNAPPVQRGVTATQGPAVAAPEIKFAVVANVYRCILCQSAARLVADAPKGVKRSRCSNRSCENY